MKDITKTITAKKKFLKENYPFENVPNLNDSKKCFHCDDVFLVKSYKVVYSKKDNINYICCPNYPKCNGTVIDWHDPDFGVF